MDSLNITSEIEAAAISIGYFHRLLKRFGVVYMALVIILGFVGNSLSCYVFVRSKLKYLRTLITLLHRIIYVLIYFRRLSCSSYLIALSLSDNGYLICLCLIWLENVHLYIFHNHGICQIGVYLTTVCSSLSVW